MYNAGVAETLLGTALKGRRDKIVLASKVFFKMGDAPDQHGLSRKAILRAIDESLTRLQTDYLDLYYLHAPDHTVPIEESLEAMESLVKQGKVRYPACSNYAGWEVVQMLWIAKERGWHAPYVSQPMYNLLARGIEQEYLADVQRVRRLDRRVQPARRRPAHRQAPPGSLHPRHALRQQQALPGPLLARPSTSTRSNAYARSRNPRDARSSASR